MQNDSTQIAINQVKAGLEHAKMAVQKVLANTPDDRINWSPSTTARTPIAVAAHIAMSVYGVQLMLEEKPRFIGEFGKGREEAVPLTGQPGEVAYPFASIAELDIAFREEEKKFSTRKEVHALMERTTSEFGRWLDTLTSGLFSSVVNTFFGPVPISFGITLPALHAHIHIAQIEYIQTIYGDLDRHA